jgi:hypothetical protein
MKKPKTLETKLRSAIRLIWSRSQERRAIKKAALDENDNFLCPLCKQTYPEWAGEVDHDPAVGSLETWLDTVEFIKKMFYGPQRFICKACHKTRTKNQRRKR